MIRCAEISDFGKLFIGLVMKLKPRNRAKRCYELSCLYLWRDERYCTGSWKLVQGEIATAGSPLGHAWLMDADGTVYDPVHNKNYAWADYEAQFRAKALDAYTAEESMRVSAEMGGHYGPWKWPPCWGDHGGQIGQPVRLWQRRSVIRE